MSLKLFSLKILVANFIIFIAKNSGHIYIWFHCDGIEPTWEIPEIPEVCSGNWTYRGRTEHFVNAHIEVRKKMQKMLKICKKSKKQENLAKKFAKNFQKQENLAEKISN